MTKSPDSTLPDYRALAEFRYQIRRFLAFSDAAAREAGIEPKQHQLLLALKGLPEHQRPTIVALAERLQLRHHSAVELVDRTVAHGFVSRSRSKWDGRESCVEITKMGDRVLHRLSRVHEDELRTVGPALVNALGRIVRERPRRPTRQRTLRAGSVA